MWGHREWQPIMATHEVLRDADPRWMYLGCVIPDLPRFLQRILLVAVPGIDPYALRAYLVVQASFFGYLLACAAKHCSLTASGGRV